MENFYFILVKMFGILLLKRTEIQSEPAFGVGKIVLQDVMAIRGRVMNDSPAFSPPSPSASPSSLFRSMHPVSPPHVLALRLNALFLSSISWMPRKDSDCHILGQSVASRRGLPHSNTWAALTVPKHLR